MSEKIIKFPVPEWWKEENEEWNRHWAAHEQEACLPYCQVCEAFEADRLTEREQEVAELKASGHILLYEKQKNEIERLREALVKIRDVKFNSLSSGLAQSKEIAEQALKGEETT